MRLRRERGGFRGATVLVQVVEVDQQLGWPTGITGIQSAHDVWLSDGDAVFGRICTRLQMHTWCMQCLMGAVVVRDGCACVARCGAAMVMTWQR